MSENLLDCTTTCYTLLLLLLQLVLLLLRILTNFIQFIGTFSTLLRESSRCQNWLLDAISVFDS